MKNFSINDKIDERLAVSLLNEDWYHEYSLFGPNEYYNDQEERIKSNYLFLVGTVQDIFSLPDCNLKLSLSYNYTLPLKKDGSLIKHLQHITFFIYEYPNEGYDSDVHEFNIVQAEHFKIIQADNKYDFKKKILAKMREKVYCNSKFITYISKSFIIQSQRNYRDSYVHQNIYFPDKATVHAENISALLRHIYFGYKNDAYHTTVKIDFIEYKKINNEMFNQTPDEYSVTKHYSIMGTNITIETKAKVLIKNQHDIIFSEDTTNSAKFVLGNDILIYKNNKPISLDELLTNALQVINSDGDHIIERISLNDINKRLIINLVKNNITNFTDYITY
ncbi:hypothetical protein [Succinatimonas hippei]|uniref:hypothetical protein n=1 Tax=Succinatimonas hippei TaxID=626938 RepID=UPI0023F75F5D|nr:hypothetical protein [Succinatimonas hippei]